MNKMYGLSCTIAAVFVLFSGTAMGANETEAQPPQPEVSETSQPPSNPPPKENAAPPPEKSSNPGNNEEPSCD